MSTPTQATNRIRRILKAHFDLKSTGNEPREALTDLLTDARHYADTALLDFFGALDESYQHYLEERSPVPKPLVRAR